MTEDDYRRLTGRCYELHEKRRPGQPTDAADGDRTDSRDAEKDGDSQDADDDTDASADDAGGDAKAPPGGKAPGSAPPPEDDDDEVGMAGEEPPEDGAPAAAGAPAGPKPDDDDGQEKPLPPNKDGQWKGKGPWRKPTTVMGASREVPRSWIHRQIRG